MLTIVQSADLYLRLLPASVALPEASPSPVKRDTEQAVRLSVHANEAGGSGAVVVGRRNVKVGRLLAGSERRLPMHFEPVEETFVV